MSKLTDSQLILLSRAAQHAEGIVEDAGSMNAGAASKVAGALIRRKLMREIRAKPGMPIWRRDDNDRAWSLVITKVGRKVIGVDEEPQQSGEPAVSAEPAESHPMPRVNQPSQLRPGSKLAMVVDLMRTVDGASISSLMEATGWLPHSARAALTGLRKRGLTIEKTQSKGEPTVYRIAETDFDPQSGATGNR